MMTRLGKALGVWILLVAAFSLGACTSPFARAKSQSRATTAKTQPVAEQAPAREAVSSARISAAAVPVQRTQIANAAVAASGPADKAADLSSVYVVRKGDTVYAISRRFGVPVRQVIAHNGLKPPYALSIGQKLSVPKPRQHTVAKKETVYGISRLYRVPVRSLIDRNKLVPPYALRIGQKLTIPDLREHTVAKGDTVYSLSRRYDIDRTELVRLNGIAPPYTIKLRQKLVLPNTRQTAPPRPVGTKLAAAAPANPAPRAIPKPPPRAGSKFLWPVQGKVILGFGPKSNGLHNDGINIKAPRGAPVKAADNGVVAYAGNELRGFGNLLLIKHAGGWVTAYAHTDKVLVRRGDKVRRGQTIGRVGSTGSVATPQLHFEVRKGTRAINPTRMLGPQTARLAN